jgi:hypothetical protein
LSHFRGGKSIKNASKTHQKLIKNPVKNHLKPHLGRCTNAPKTQKRQKKTKKISHNFQIYNQDIRGNREANEQALERKKFVQSENSFYFCSRFCEMLTGEKGTLYNRATGAAGAPKKITDGTGNKPAGFDSLSYRNAAARRQGSLTVTDDRKSVKREFYR